MKNILIVGPISEKIEKIYNYVKNKCEVTFIPFNKLKQSDIIDYNLILVLIDLTAPSSARFGLISKEGLLNAINLENKSKYFISAIADFQKTNIIPIRYLSANKALEDLEELNFIFQQQRPGEETPQA